METKIYTKVQKEKEAGKVSVSKTIEILTSMAASIVILFAIETH